MKEKTFAQAPGGRDNNLNLMRLIAALMVIFSHAFPLTGSGDDYITQLSGGQTSIGNLGITVFFFCGGFLMMKSMEGKKTARAYFRARCERIFPALWIVVAACAFLLGPAVTRLPLRSYLTAGGTWKYLLNGLLIPVHPLPGVFEGNPFPEATVNGSLWTLPVEFLCYVLCWIFYKAGFARRDRRTLISIPLVFAAAAGAMYLLRDNELIASAIQPVVLFFLGMQAWLWKDRLPNSPVLFAGSLALLAVSLWFRFFTWGQYFCVPMILMTLAFGLPPKAAGFGRKREISYGIYLAAWPVQQTLCQLIPGISQLANFALAAVICVPLAIGITMLENRIVSAIHHQ